MKKTILISYPEMMIGGSTTSLLSLLNTIDYEKYEVDIIMYRNKGEFLNDIPEQVNILSQASKYPKNSFISKIKKATKLLINGYLFKAVFYQLKYKKKIGLNTQIMGYAQAAISRKLNQEYDVAIGYLELWADAYILKNVNAKKKISWVHVDYKKALFIPEIDREQFNKSDIIVCVSTECLKNFKFVFPELANKSVFLDNILSEKCIKSKSQETVCDFDDKYSGLKIITVCRLDIYTKGLDRAVIAAKKLLEDGYEFRWYIIGKGDGRKQIEKMISQYGLKNKMILLGKKINPYPYYKKCDVYVMPSRYEGKPMSVTEAQMLGLPVIVTNYSSAEEQVKNNIDSMIVDNDDTSIYYGIKKIFNEPKLLDEYKKNLKNRHLSNEYIINEFYKLIKFNNNKGKI